MPFRKCMFRKCCLHKYLYVRPPNPNPCQDEQQGPFVVQVGKGIFISLPISIILRNTTQKWVICTVISRYLPCTIVCQVYLSSNSQLCLSPVQLDSVFLLAFSALECPLVLTLSPLLCWYHVTIDIYITSPLLVFIGSVLNWYSLQV